MKRTTALTVLLVLAGLGTAAAQTSSTGAAQTPSGTATQSPPAKKATASQTSPTSPNLVTLNGCVSPTSDARQRFTLADVEEGEQYVLTGLNVKDFAGKRVEITGSTNASRLKVVGGLYPSANVAAQAGAIDPAKAAIAAQSGPTANAPKPPIEFRVKSVRTIAGACPES